MGLMISSIAKIKNSVIPKNLFNSNSDYYLYILEYSDFDFKVTPNYSSEFHNSEMSTILNNYKYNFKNPSVKKIKSNTFHSDGIMSWSKIFDVENLNSDEKKPAKVTPSFLFTTILPTELNKLSIENVSNEIFAFLKIQPKDRDANRIPQFINQILSNIGFAVTNSRKSNFTSSYKNIFFFDYSPDDDFEKNHKNEKHINNSNEVLGILKSIKNDTSKILSNQENFDKALTELTFEQTSEIVNEIMNWVTLVSVELNDELENKLEEIKTTDDIKMKLKLSIPFINILGVKFETEFDVKSWTKKMYKKYELEIFKLMGMI